MSEMAPQNDTKTGGNDQLEKIQISPFAEISQVRDSVLIRERRGNLVQKIFLDEEQWREIGRLADWQLDTGTEQADKEDYEQN